MGSPGRSYMVICGENYLCLFRGLTRGLYRLVGRLGIGAVAGAKEPDFPLCGP